MSAVPGGRTHAGRRTLWRDRRGDLLRLLLRRAAVAVPVLAGLSVLVFLLADRSPFDPLAAHLGAGYQQSSAGQREELSSALGLDAPWWQAWGAWVVDLFRGDAGWSRVYAMPVAEVFAGRLPWTLLLSGTAMAVAVPAALACGTAAGLAPGGRTDRAITRMGVFVQAVPPFVVALGAVTVFAVLLRWAPVAGAAEPGEGYTAAGVLSHLVLPATTLALTQLPWMLLAVRTAVARAVASEPVRAARARGLSRRRTVTGHVLPMSLAPLVTIVGARLPELVVGAVLVEEVFAWPGIASALVASAQALDFPLLAALTVATAAVVLAGSLAADTAYLLLDPRVSSDV
ncbi:ABC transporter permease [Nocardiopsis sp. HNM0947]|uniref:ABC transporter permease n=1 Tax=Nocardiopsis coralli TaxID=2772213 RepID=A0ABR9P2Z4_9ACTN|nr:ABC transporter permease [Nocardiopsis coralli]MBE2998223.1 ABC transporter permease [Nocardiopsis coralli]